MEWTDTDEIAYLRSRVEELENELAEAGKNQSEYHNTVLAQEKEVARLREMVRWIPVWERLPEINVKVEVCDRWWKPQTSTYERVIIHDIYDGKKWQQAYSPTHWKPMPEPPEVE